MGLDDTDNLLVEYDFLYNSLFACRNFGERAHQPCKTPEAESRSIPRTKLVRSAYEVGKVKMGNEPVPIGSRTRRGAMQGGPQRGPRPKADVAPRTLEGRVEKVAPGDLRGHSAGRDHLIPRKVAQGNPKVGHFRRAWRPDATAEAAARSVRNMGSTRR